MVHQPAERSKTIKTVLDVLIVVAVAIATFALFKLTTVKPENQEVNNPDVITKIPEPEDETETESKLELQSVISMWRSGLPSGTNAGVIAYDLENERFIGETNADERFLTASLYKLFVVYEGYRRVEIGEWTYDDASYGGRTVGECLDLAIRESLSGCAENILYRIGAGNMDYIVQYNYGLENTSVQELYTTARDTAKMLKIYFEHKDLSDETFARILDSMFNQPTSDPDGNCDGACNWRMGTPSGFSVGNVYNKVGWNYDGAKWTIFNDAMMIEYPEKNRHFILVALTTNFPSTRDLTRLGELVDEALDAQIKLE